VESSAPRAGLGVAGGEDAPVHRREVGREEELGADLLLHLGGVAVREQAVRGHVLVDGREAVGKVGLAAGAGDSGRGVDDHAGRLDQAGLDERPQRERRRRHVAAGRRDEACSHQLGTVQLGEPVDGLGEQVGLVVLEAVVRRVVGGVLSR
jgi:hypothetical protein